MMIVDDEPIMREGLEVYLDWKSYLIGNIVTAQDGYSAIEIAQKEKPDIIITDIRMPDMTGLELIEQVNKFLPDCICIIISGYNDFEYAKKGMELGAFYYIVKPIELEELKMVISNAVVAAKKKKQEKEIFLHFQENDITTNQSLIQNFLTNLISNKTTLTSEQFELEQLKLGMDFQYPYYAVCVTMLWVKDKLTQRINNSIFSVINQKIQEQLTTKCLIDAKAYSINIQNSVVIVLGFKNFKEVERRMEDMYHSISETINQCFGILMATTLGTSVSTGNEMLFSYIGAEKLCSYKMFFNKYGFYCVDSSDSSYKSNPFILTFTEKKDFINMIKTNDIDGIFNTLNILKNNTKHPIHQDKDVLFSVLLEIMISAARVLDVKKIKLEQFLDIEIFTYDFLDTFNNAEQLFKWLLDLFTLISNAYIDKENTELESCLTEQIKKYAQENLTNKITLSQIADHFHYNYNYIGRIFKKEEGVKFSDYLNGLRIDKACEFLKNTDSAIEEIALKSGYNNAQYFIKVFKEITGLTPGEYRLCTVDCYD